MRVPEGFFRGHESHKTSSGRLAILAGSHGLIGAGLLSAHAAVRGGCGYVRWCVPEKIYSAVAAHFLDGIVTSLFDGGSGHFLSHHIEVLQDFYIDAILIGPGIGVCAQRRKLVSDVLRMPVPMVVDADGLNALCLTPFREREAATVWTPHPGEAARILGCEIQAIQQDREASIRSLHEKLKGVVVLKGVHTLVFDGSELWSHDQAAPILATAGSGDVLAGLIAAMLARGVSAVNAAKFAIFWHGLAAKQIEARIGVQGIGASKILDVLTEIQQNGFNLC